MIQKKPAKVTKSDLNCIKDDLKHGASYAEIQRAYGVSSAMMQYYKKKGMIPKPVFKANDVFFARANRLRKEGMAYEKIARVLNVSYSYMMYLKRKGKLI